MGTMEFEWELVAVRNSKGFNYKNANTVWLSAKNAKPEDTRLNTINISANLVVEAGWKDGIRVNLYRQGKTMFMLKPSTVGLYYPRRATKDSRAMRITNMVLTAELYPATNGTRFDAWVDGDTIYFKPANK